MSLASNKDIDGSSNSPENCSVKLDEKDFEFIEELVINEFWKNNRDSIQSFLQYHHKLVQECEKRMQVGNILSSSATYHEEHPERELEDYPYPLLSGQKSLTTLIFYNQEYPDQIIYLQKIRNNSNLMNRDIEAIIKGHGFRVMHGEDYGESSVDKFLSAISLETKRPWADIDKKILFHSYETLNEDLLIYTFYNPKYPDQIVHWQQTQNDEQLEGGHKHAKLDIPILLKVNGFIKLKTQKEMDVIFSDELSYVGEASDSLIKGTVLYKQFANHIESNSAFKDNGAIIAESLREFSRKIFDAGTNFEAMYRKGDILFLVLENQINLILNRVKPSLFSRLVSKDDAPYIKERLEKINMEILSFEEKLKKATDSMEDAENRREFAEKVLFKGRGEAANFVYSSQSKQENHREHSEAQELLERAEGVLNLLNQTAVGLVEIKKLLSNYRFSLDDAKAEVNGKTSVTEEDIDKLKEVLGIVQEYHKGFVRKSEKITT
ncbi:15306_t:CDS:2 [Acaulospora colombiana]|uniref:15306_t:CDS:1 n=1 Tax=Acaulospora colombiana TaxID=27376 RepID=A0ACA9LUK2_9GLOM|nr:15306_t:CDS:2 [Acaulospora colombiana]